MDGWVAVLWVIKDRSAVGRCLWTSHMEETSAPLVPILTVPGRGCAPIETRARPPLQSCFPVAAKLRAPQHCKVVITDVELRVWEKVCKNLLRRGECTQACCWQLGIPQS